MYVTGNSKETYRFTEEYDKLPHEYNYKELIHICHNKKLNTIGDVKTDLSKSWYLKNSQDLANGAIKTLQNNMYNFFRNVMKSKTSNNLWTCFSDYRNLLSGKGYAKGYIPSNARATNNYRTRTVIAYPINKYMHTYVKTFFLANGVSVDEDGYALSEMLQWIWRSAIRDGKEIWIYIPSRRMITLLENWINENSPDVSLPLPA